jgi:hypothetical protein
MTLGNVARVVAVLAACTAAVGSAGSSSGQSGSMIAPPGQPSNQPPPPQEMDASRALGLWRSTFGAVKIEPDESKGGLSAGAVQGVWVYERLGQEVIGYFAGTLRGNVLELGWQEPNDPPLVGQGYLVFDVHGRQFSGRWWSDRRDRVGDWNGWRHGSAQPTDTYGDPSRDEGRYREPPRDDGRYRELPRDDGRYREPPRDDGRYREPTRPAPAPRDPTYY